MPQSSQSELLAESRESPVRLAILGPAYPLRGGIALHGAEMAAAAEARGHQVDLISFRRLYPRLLFPGRSQREVGNAPPPGRPVHEWLDSVSPLSWWQAGRAVAELRPDVLVMQHWHPFFLPALATVARRARRRGTRVVWMVHNVEPHEGSRIFVRPVATIGMRTEDVFLTHAESVARELRSLLPGASVIVVRHPAPVSLSEHAAAGPSRRALGLSDDEVVFLFFGHVRRYKGVDVLLEALQRLTTSNTPWRAVIAGEWYIDRSRADAEISRPPLAGRVMLIDRYIPKDEVATYFAAATVVVLPYRSGTQSGVVPLAYAHGKGVIAGNVGGLAEVVIEGETGHLVPPDDPKALASALRDVLRGARFSEEAIATAHRASSWGPFVETLEQIAAISGHPTRYAASRAIC